MQYSIETLTDNRKWVETGSVLPVQYDRPIPLSVVRRGAGAIRAYMVKLDLELAEAELKAGIAEANAREAEARLREAKAKREMASLPPSPPSPQAKAYHGSGSSFTPYIRENGYTVIAEPSSSSQLPSMAQTEYYRRLFKLRSVRKDRTLYLPSGGLSSVIEVGSRKLQQIRDYGSGISRGCLITMAAVGTGRPLYNHTSTEFVGIVTQHLNGVRLQDIEVSMPLVDNYMQPAEHNIKLLDKALITLNDEYLWTPRKAVQWLRLMGL